MFAVLSQDQSQRSIETSEKQHGCVSLSSDGHNGLTTTPKFGPTSCNQTCCSWRFWLMHQMNIFFYHRCRDCKIEITSSPLPCCNGFIQTHSIVTYKAIDSIEWFLYLDKTKIINVKPQGRVGMRHQSNRLPRLYEGLAGCMVERRCLVPSMFWGLGQAAALRFTSAATSGTACHFSFKKSGYSRD